MALPTSSELTQEWAAMSAAPWLYAACVIAAWFVLWRILEWRYRATIERANEAANHDQREISNLNTAIDEAHNQQLLLERRIATLTPPPLRLKSEVVVRADEVENFLHETKGRVNDVLHKMNELYQYAPQLIELLKMQERVSTARSKQTPLAQFTEKLSPEELKTLRDPFLSMASDLYRTTEELRSFLREA
jgi:hypothetical protein